MIKEQSCVIDVYIGKLRGGVATSLKLEIKFSPNFTTHLIYHIYISIIILAEQQLRVLIVQPLMCEGEILPPADKNAPLLSQSGSYDTRLNRHLLIVMQTFALELSEGRQFCKFCAQLLCIDLWLIPWTCVAVQCQTFS